MGTQDGGEGWTNKSKDCTVCRKVAVAPVNMERVGVCLTKSHVGERLPQVFIYNPGINKPTNIDSPSTPYQDTQLLAPILLNSKPRHFC